MYQNVTTSTKLVLTVFYCQSIQHQLQKETFKRKKKTAMDNEKIHPINKLAVYVNRLSEL